MNSYKDNGHPDYFVCHDQLFSPEALVYSSGAIVERYDYDAYGKPVIYTATGAGGWWEGNETTATVSAKGLPYLFTGRELDVLDNGGLLLQYSRARYYNFDLRRWLQRDPTDYVDRMSLYEYAAGKPQEATDPFGRFPIFLSGCAPERKLPSPAPETPEKRGAAFATSLRFCCDCVVVANLGRKWDGKMQNEYNTALKDTNNKTGRDIEKEIAESLKAQGILTYVAGTTSPTGKVVIKPQTGPCAKLIETHTSVHEERHQKHQKELEDKYGKGTDAYWKAWNSASNWARDEIGAYGDGVIFYGGFLKACEDKFKVTLSTSGVTWK